MDRDAEPKAERPVRLDMEAALRHAYHHGLLIGLCERLWDAAEPDSPIRNMLSRHFGDPFGPPFV